MKFRFNFNYSLSSIINFDSSRNFRFAESSHAEAQRLHLNRVIDGVAKLRTKRRFRKKITRASVDLSFRESHNTIESIRRATIWMVCKFENPGVLHWTHATVHPNPYPSIPHIILDLDVMAEILNNWVVSRRNARYVTSIKPSSAIVFKLIETMNGFWIGY